MVPGAMQSTKTQMIVAGSKQLAFGRRRATSRVRCSEMRDGNDRDVALTLKSYKCKATAPEDAPVSISE